MKALILAAIVATSLTAQAEEPTTQFLVPGPLLFEATFDDGVAPAKPQWYLRKSAWTIEDGVLRGINTEGNGPFLRLHSKEGGGPLPEDYIMQFSFKIEENPAEKKSNKHHKVLSSGHRFSFGHYDAKFQWRPELGMDIAIGHGHALGDASYQIEKGKWYHVTAEIRGDEILVWFKDGPAYFLQHEAIRDRPSGWEFFTHVSEVGYLDKLRVWALGEGERDDWTDNKAEIVAVKRAFLSSEHPDFSVEKIEKADKD
jgi:hypothetical protein